MTKRMRVQSVKTLGALALVAPMMFVFQACGGGNNPSNTPGSAGSTSPGSAGSSNAGSAGTTGGTTGTGGSIGGSTGGSTAGTGGGAPGTPSCVGLTTASGMEPAKNVPCVATDPQLCYRTCGPEKTGYKAEMCQTSGSYSEMSGCTFPETPIAGGDYACYKIPAAANTMCPKDATTGAYTVPKGSDPCTIDACVVCNDMGGISGGNYSDSGGAVKPGYCVCQQPDQNGARKWSCGSTTAWPCPGKIGC